MINNNYYVRDRKKKIYNQFKFVADIFTKIPNNLPEPQTCL